MEGGVKVATAGLVVINQIRRAVLRGEWEPAGTLRPVALAERFGTSTTVIREALTRLAGDGIVVMKPNRGFFVPELNLRELGDITELRCVSEALAAGLALERGDVEWESELIAAHHRLARTPRREASDVNHLSEEWSAAHRAFHAKLLEASDCPQMIRLSANLADATELYRRWAAPSPAAAIRDVEKEHQEILDAALARDADKLSALLRSHFEATVQVVLDAGLGEGQRPL